MTTACVNDSSLTSTVHIRSSHSIFTRVSLGDEPGLPGQVIDSLGDFPRGLVGLRDCGGGEVRPGLVQHPHPAFSRHLKPDPTDLIPVPHGDPAGNDPTACPCTLPQQTPAT